MRLKNVLIVVDNIQRAVAFYEELFGLEVILDQEGNVIMTEGLVLQDKTIWKQFLERDIVSKSNAAELYFEEEDIEAFAEKLEQYHEPIQYVNRLMEHSWGQKVIRFYDPDGNLIEVGNSSACNCAPAAQLAANKAKQPGIRPLVADKLLMGRIP